MRHPRSSQQRGMALIIVTFVLIVVLVGGLAVIAMTSGELSSTRGYRGRALTDACANAAIEKIRAKLPDVTVDDIDDTYVVAATSTSPGFEVTLSATHGGLSGTDPVIVDLASDSYDAASLMAGENITNTMGSAAGATRLMTAVATCTSAGGGTREIQIILRYNAPLGS